MADVLQKLFGSAARVKMLRLFLFNAGEAYTVREVGERTKTKPAEARKEALLLCSIGFLAQIKKKDGAAYTLNTQFAYLVALQNLILNTPVRTQDIYKQIEGVGSIKLVVTSGIFMNNREVALDLFIVGDKINDKKLKNRLQVLEAEIGKELRYTVLASEDFFYRLNISDRLVRDVFDYPHRIVYDRLDIGLK